MTKHNRFPPEVRQRAIRMVLENQNTYNAQWPPREATRWDADLLVDSCQSWGW